LIASRGKILGCLSRRLAAAEDQHGERGEGASQRMGQATNGMEWFASWRGVFFLCSRNALGDGNHGWNEVGGWLSWLKSQVERFDRLGSLVGHFRQACPFNLNIINVLYYKFNSCAETSFPVACDSLTALA
jgi:hypothetical protein